MRRYETTYILRPNLGEDQFSEVIDRTANLIKKDGGDIIILERWGNKKLAYEIKKENFGQYVYIDFAAPGTTIKEMERLFRIDDRVLRYLTVKLADDIDQETIDREKELAVTSAAERAQKATFTEGDDDTNTETDDDDDDDDDENSEEDDSVGE